MNKKLLFGLFAFALGAQAFAQTRATELCVPDNEYQSYACISRVEMNGLVSESNPGDPQDREAAVFMEDFRNDPTRKFTLEAGKTYELKVQFSNFNSGPADTYSLCAFFDWNNDMEYSTAETLQVEVLAGRTGGFVNKRFDVVVPATATGTINMRVFTFFLDKNSPTAPCGLVESGQFEEYMVEITAPSSIGEDTQSGFSVYPNPARGELFIEGVIAQTYSLFAIDGKEAARGTAADNKISLGGIQPGMYILKLMTEKGVKVSTVIVE